MKPCPPQALSLDEQAAWWLLHRHDEGVTEQDLRDWMAQSDLHRQVFQRFESTAHALDAIPPGDIPSAWRPRKTVSIQGRRHWLGRSLAAGMTIAGGAVGVSLWRIDQSQPVYERQFATARGQVLSVSLPDGSRIELDAGTVVQVRFFRDHRDVKLAQGRAQFLVSGNVSRPFHVDVAQARVTVVGTEFTVQRRANCAEVNVIEGLVRVDSGNPQAGWTHLLRRGQVLRTDLAGVSVELGSRATSTMAAWRQGRIVFDATPLAEGWDEFAQYAPDFSWRLSDASLGALRVSGSFEVSKAESFLRALPVLLPIQVRRQGQTRVIERR